MRRLNQRGALRNFLFDLENGTIVHLARPIATLREGFSRGYSGGLATSTKTTLSAGFCHLFLHHSPSPSSCDRLPLETRPPSLSLPNLLRGEQPEWRILRQPLGVVDIFLAPTGQQLRVFPRRIGHVPRDEVVQSGTSNLHTASTGFDRNLSFCTSAQQLTASKIEAFFTAELGYESFPDASCSLLPGPTSRRWTLPR